MAITNAHEYSSGIGRNGKIEESDVRGFEGYEFVGSKTINRESDDQI